MTRYFTVFFLITLSMGLFAQNDKSMRKLEKQAYEHIVNKEHAKAKPLYLQLKQMDATKEENLFFLGISYLGTAEDNLAISEFGTIIQSYETTKKESTFVQTAYYYSAMAYSNLYLYAQALENLRKIEQFELNKTSKAELAEAIKRVEEAEKIFADFKPIVVTRLAILNTPYDEHTPIPTADGSKLFFTSKRPGGVSGEATSPEGKMFEDVWIWDKNKGLKSAPYNMGAPINTDQHEATCGLSPDGKILFIFKGNDKQAGDIYISRLKDTLWTAPEAMSKKINKKNSVERHASVTPDGKKLYFSSDKRGGKGGRDIWVSELRADSTWGTPTTVAELNTDRDEESPFVLPDGKTMYFSSSGFYGLGEYDVFKSVQNPDGTWATPVNVGAPINTSAEDVFYFPLSDEKSSYFTRKKAESADIFKVNLYDSEDNVLIVSGIVKDNKEYSKIYGVQKVTSDTIFYNNRYFVKQTPITAMPDSVIVSKLDKNEVLDTVYFVPNNESIKIIELENGKYTDAYTTNSDKGDYQFLLLGDKDYKAHYDAPGYVFDSYNVYGSTKTGARNEKYNAVLTKIELGETEKIKETPFDKGSSDFNMFTRKELDLIILSMNTNPELLVNFSTEDYMKDSDDLSNKRKQNAVDYLIENGIAKDRIYTDLSPRDIPKTDLEYTIYDTESVKKAIEDKDERKKEVTIVVPTDYVVEIENVYFEFNKFDLKVKPNDGLNKLAEYLARNSSAKIEIVGYTDAVGTDTYNNGLSNKRAKTVQQYLIDKGAKADQMTSVGYGERNPITQNMKDGKWSEESKQYNRRVEFRIKAQGQPTITIKQLEKVPASFKDSKYDVNYSGK